MSKLNLKFRLSEKLQDSQSELTDSTERKNVYMPKAKVLESSTVNTVAQGRISLPANALDIINENLKNRPLSRQSIDVIKSPAGGTTAFTVPCLAGEDIQKELVGVILDYTTPRAYWETPDPVEGTPPTCYSMDSIVSHDGKPCARCVYNTFGSKEGDSNAKACKESVELYLLRQDNIMPVIVRIPVSSKTIFQKYMTRLVSSMIPVCGVVTKITLEKATSRAGQPYAKYIFEAVDTLTLEETNGLRAFSQDIMAVLSAVNEQELGEVV